MVSPSRAYHKNRNCVPIVLLISILIHISSSRTNTRTVVQLRSGAVELIRPVRVASGQLNISVTDTTADPAGGPRGVVADGGPPGGEGPALFLVHYGTSGSNGGASLRSDLDGHGCKVVSYIPPDTLLVYGPDKYVHEAADRNDALVGEYLAMHKLSPEMSSVTAAASPARRRRLQQLDGDGSQSDSSHNGDEGSGAAAADVLSSELQFPTELQRLKTWKHGSLKMSSGGIKAGGPKGSTMASSSLSTPQSGGADLYGINIHIVPGVHSEALRSMITEGWVASLAALLRRDADQADPCRPRARDSALHAPFNPRLQLYLCAEDIEDAAAWLSGQHAVTWLDPAMKTRASNAAGGWLLQTGDLSLSRYKNLTGELRPYWKAGIQGNDTIVGVTDTGIDLSHCSFIDDKYDPWALEAKLRGYPLRWTLPDHRKVVQYILTQDGPDPSWFYGDEKDGHGTHVCGTIAGARKTGLALRLKDTGAAPAAKLSLFDVSAPKYGYFMVPEPVEVAVLPLHYEAGARISSESWGLDGTRYDDLAQGFDLFAWRHPDFLTVVAAGNKGENSFMATVETPATAKNVLSVGASTNHPKSVTDFGDQNMFLFRYRDSNGTLRESALWPDGSDDYDWYQDWRNLVQRTGEVPLVLANPLGACSPLIGDYSGRIVIVDTGVSSCSDETRASYVGFDSEAGGRPAGVIYIRDDDMFASYILDYNDDDGNYFFSDDLWIAVNRAHGNFLKGVMQDPNNSDFRIAYVTYPQVNMGIESIASFSAHGPWPWDGLVKPDIVAPGSYVLSSASGGDEITQGANSSTCPGESMYLYGTSMAAPMVSGHLALMRQYFRDGMYPEGDRSALGSTGFEPSGMLLKAAAIAGAKSLEGGYARSAGVTLGGAPDPYQGWGRLDLSGALPLPGLTNPNMRLQVADMGTITQGQVVTLTGIRATGTGPIIAALAWHDYPASVPATNLLVNDLDLKYRINTGPFAVTREDHINNVERVELEGEDLKARDNVTLMVQGTKIVHDIVGSGADAQLSQRWAVVVVGHFQGTLQTQLNPAYARPQRLPLSIANGAPMSEYGIRQAGRTSCVSSPLDNTTVPAVPVISMACNNGTARLSVAEMYDSFTGGYLYIVKDYLGRCLTLAQEGGTMSLATCVTNDANQQLAVFRNAYHTNRDALQLVPRPLLGNPSGNRQCLRGVTAPALAGSSGLQVAQCDENDPEQAFLLESLPTPAPPVAVTSPPAMVASSVEPSAAVLPRPPRMPWLRFRVAWTIQGVTSKYTDDLDIMVAWAAADDKEYHLSYLQQYVRGGMYEGDNRYSQSSARYASEAVSWPDIESPPESAEYRVCVLWYQNRGYRYNVTLGVSIGDSEVLAGWRVIDGQTAYYDKACTSTVPGFVGNFTYKAPSPSPPRLLPLPADPSPVPPSPLANSSSSPNPPALPWLRFKMEWEFVGREEAAADPSTADLDIQVTWMAGGNTHYIDAYKIRARGGQLEFDNIDVKPQPNWEAVAWDDAARPPDATEYLVCAKWWYNMTSRWSNPTFHITLTVFAGGDVVASSLSRRWNTTQYPFLRDRCNKASLGFIGSFSYPPSRRSAGLSSAIVAGCVIGAIVAASIIAGVITFVNRRRRLEQTAPSAQLRA